MAKKLSAKLNSWTKKFKSSEGSCPEETLSALLLKDQQDLPKVRKLFTKHPDLAKSPGIVWRALDSGASCQMITMIVTEFGCDVNDGGPKPGEDEDFTTPLIFAMEQVNKTQDQFSFSTCMEEKRI